MLRTLHRPPVRTVKPGRSTQTLAVDARAVVKTYGSNGQTVQALRGIDLAVEPGESVAIMGPSGCGKTTLLNCLSGLDEVDAGIIRVDGADIARLPDKARTSLRATSMGFIFQTYNLLPVLSAVENVELPLVVSGAGASEARARSLHALERVGILAKAGERPARLSGGQRQRVAIARALVNNPRIVWADEPTGALDSATANDVMSLLEDLNRDHGLTLVIVTHDPAVGRRCHRTVHMQDGHVLSEERHK